MENLLLGRKRSYKKDEDVRWRWKRRRKTRKRGRREGVEEWVMPDNDSKKLQEVISEKRKERWEGEEEEEEEWQR